MKTDIANSTRQFRALLQDDLHSLLVRHRASVERSASGFGGTIFRGAGDGYWLEFPSVTAAAKAAIQIQEVLRLEQTTKGDDRLSMRIVISVGEVAETDGELIGNVFALVTRIEAMTPADEIYLSSAAHDILARAEINTAEVGSFQLKGFADPVQIYRVDLRHRTRIIPDACIVLLDLRGFTPFMRSASVSVIEGALDTLDSLVRSIAPKFAGNVLHNVGDSFVLSFGEPVAAMAASEQLERAWEGAPQSQRGDCGLDIAVHRGALYSFRSFLYGDALLDTSNMLASSRRLLADHAGGIVVTGAIRDALPAVPWHERLQAQPLNTQPPVYRLVNA